MSNASNDPTEPQLEVVGHREGDFIVWHDGSPPTPVPADLNTKPADGVCRSAADNEEE